MLGRQIEGFGKCKGFGNIFCGGVDGIFEFHITLWQTNIAIENAHL
jgi:hypothetical protein